jgi:(p)ppGpp synthase/HD superfamily hydrolase
MMYSRTYFSKEELQDALRVNVDPLEFNRIMSAYDMSDVAYNDKKSLNNTPYFFHTSRVCKILVHELSIYDPDLIVCSLLHGVLDANTEITPQIISYNFGAYVAYMLTILRDEYHVIDKTTMPLELYKSSYRIPADDYLIIWLAEHLDNFRSLEISPLFNPINYILNTVSILFPAAEKSENQLVHKLLQALKQERNKILG